MVTSARACPESLAEHIRRVVDTAPPLSPAQRARLGALLAGTPAEIPTAASAA